MNILPGDVKFIIYDEARREQAYAIKSPLTHSWMEFRVSPPFRASEKFFTSRFYTESEGNAVTEYYILMRELLPRFRDFQALNHDVTALCEEEARIFGVKAPPRTSRKRRIHSVEEYVKIYGE
jgi:hypothetical protein